MSAREFAYEYADGYERVREACALRDEWLAYGLSTRPAERADAEDAVGEIYRLLGEAPPRFEWVASPAAALDAVRDEPGFRGGPLRYTDRPQTARASPLPDRLARMESALRHRLGEAVAEPWTPPWSHRGPLPPGTAAEEALAAGLPVQRVLRTAVGDALKASVADAVRAAVRHSVGTVPGLMTWYGQHDAHWVGHYDVCARVGAARYRAQDAAELRLWARLARATGWWWAAPGRCVMAERPTAVRTEPAPAAAYGEIRLHRENGPAVRFADGSTVHVLHGTVVPEWVVTGPTVERIHAEANIEVRRSAIERIGWGAYVEQAGLELVGTADDPGNPGFRLSLYDVPAGAWGRPGRLLLTVNGSVEPDGRRRRYGLGVPAHLDDPLDAAGWTYGVSGQQYAQLVRRT
ncbi:hypothetical protein OG239_28620 [Streptomyces sp. NBC_00868]|uniref:DUF6745 domain-containing protein n=1 Tax=Streptomyces sp. NBC_00868 TaxID=2903683 RepID=UPI00386EF07D|nr:hypothetical protein OG239_28620 [Streptomyces sp. NBC_00868]